MATVSGNAGAARFDPAQPKASTAMASSLPTYVVTTRPRTRDGLYNRPRTQRGWLIPRLGIRELRHWHGFCFLPYEPKASSRSFQVPFAVVAFVFRPR